MAAELCSVGMDAFFSFEGKYVLSAAWDVSNFALIFFYKQRRLG